jgi:LemA protein
VVGVRGIRIFGLLVFLAVLFLMFIIISGKGEAILSTLKWVCLGAVALLVIAVIAIYVNKIIRLGNRVDYAWSQIDVQLKNRIDLIPNLVSTVQGYMKHEQKAIQMVTDARAKMMGAGTVDEKMKAHDELTSALKTIFALSENYPKLRASENFQTLQGQLSEVESRIANARQLYNEAVLNYNNAVGTLPGIFIASLMGRKKKPYFEIEESERQTPTVGFAG